MLNTRQMKMILNMPKAENHIHIEGSIPWELALELGQKNHVPLPADTTEGIREWVQSILKKDGLNGFMLCDRTINSVCLHEEDYEAVVMALAKNAASQNVIYQELHLDYPLNEERGIPMEVVMEGYRSAQKKAKALYGVEIVYIAGLDRTLSSEQCVRFVRSLEKYRDMVDGLGMDCEEKGHPCIKHKESYALAKDMGLFLTAHAGEDDGAYNIWDAIRELKVTRIDHGCRCLDDAVLMKYLKDNEILCAMCPTSNLWTGAAGSYEEHPAVDMMRAGIPISISSDDPPYMVDLVQEYALALEKMHFTEDELIQTARNAFLYSIKGQKYLPVFDQWASGFIDNKCNKSH